MGRKCAVPNCYTGYRNCTEKASLYRVPDNDYYFNKWQEAICREDRPITPRDFVCEKHFKEGDIVRTRRVKDVVEVYQRPKLRPDAIPCIFPDLPDSIPKMVKKRRKIMPNDEPNNSTIELIANGRGQSNTIDIKQEFDNIEVKNEDLLKTNEIEIKSEVIDDTVEYNNDKNQEIQPKHEIYSDSCEIYQCDECSFTTRYPNHLHAHKTKHLESDEIYMVCPHCPNFRTKWIVNFSKHLKKKHKLRSKKALRDYQRTSIVCNTSKPDVFKCESEGCTFETNNKTLLESHKLVHSNESQKSFRCTECNYETNSKTHILNHIKSLQITGDDTVVSVKSKTINETRRNGKSVYNCPNCPYKTRFHSLLLRHFLAHRSMVFEKKEEDEGENTASLQKCKVWKCPKCPYATFFEDVLKQHQTVECLKYQIFNVSLNRNDKL